MCKPSLYSTTLHRVKSSAQLRQPAITVEKSVECFMLKRGTPMIPKTQYLLWKKESEDGIGYKDETTTMKKIEEKQVEKIADRSL